LLVLRRAQIQAFERYVLRQFESSTRAVLRERWPERCAALGDDGLLAAIHDGIRHARRHGIASPPDVRTFIFLRFLLGDGFDSDPRYPWAALILGDPARRPHRKVAALAACAAGALGAEAGRALGD
jgi:hypothetical protein